MDANDTSFLRKDGMAHMREAFSLIEKNSKANDGDPNPLNKVWSSLGKRRTERRITKHAAKAAANFKAILDVCPNDESAREYLRTAESWLEKKSI